MARAESFTALGGIPSDGLPYPVFTYVALVPWQFFANGLTNTSSSLVSNEETSTIQTVLAEAARIFQVAIGLPGRADRVLTLMERGDLNVQTPLLNLQVRRLERSVNRMVSGLVFAALLIAGAIVNGSSRGRP